VRSLSILVDTDRSPRRPVLVEHDEGVGIVSLNRPERHNAIDDETGDALEAALAEVMADDGVRVVLLRGEGPSFCSGRDTTQLGRRTEGDNDFAFLRRHSQRREAQLGQPKPIVAALKGYALGGGLEMALACDMRVAADDIRLAFPEVRYGLVTDTGGSPLTTVLAGPSRAKWMLMTGEYVEAERALAWGLVDQVVAPEALDVTARALCHRLAQVPGQLLAMIKQLVDQTWEAQISAGLRSEMLAQLALFSQRRPVTEGGTGGIA
jgi:enoyl-CoA hydratase/carnithine racemase